jgi:hypothetical protein
MKKHKIKLIGGFMILLLLPFWLFFGVFQDREFATLYLFSKHRPSAKFFFYAPIGESDTHLEDLPSPKQYEEKAFDEFVYTGGGYDRRIRLFSY